MRGWRRVSSARADRRRHDRTRGSPHTAGRTAAEGRKSDRRYRPLPHRGAPLRPISRSRLLSSFAAQAVIAIENTRLFEEVQARHARACPLGGGTQVTGRGEPDRQLLARAGQGAPDHPRARLRHVLRRRRHHLRVRQGERRVPPRGRPQHERGTHRDGARPADASRQRRGRRMRRTPRGRADRRPQDRSALADARHPAARGRARRACRPAHASGRGHRCAGRAAQPSRRLLAGDHPPARGLCRAIGDRRAQRSPVRRGRAEGPPARGRQPAQVAVRGQHEP